MNAIVIAVNHALGAIVIELEDKSCAVLEAPNQFFVDIGDTLNGDWKSADMISIQNTTKENGLAAQVQKFTKTRDEAIGAISLI